ncbi:MAG: alkane 1-monooxygenase [Chitinophagales bacterium]
MNPWIFLRFLFLPALVIAGSLFGDWWNFSIPIICFVIHPIGSLLSGKISSNDPEEHQLNKRKAYSIIPLLFVPVLISLTAWSVIQSNSISVIAFAGLAISVGIVNGILGFTLSHELIHRHTWFQKIAGHLLLIQNNYPYYGIEHIRGHHVYACTEKDPHTAGINESFYRFLPRAIRCTFFNAWEIESARLQHRKKNVISLHNQMLQFILLQFFCYAIIIVFAGWKPFLFFIFQSVVAILLLNITGYLQHYGLKRKEAEQGRFEKIAAHHAWSSRPGKDGLNLFHVGNHADHHMHPAHSYEQLVHHHDSPQQPTGYSGMIWLALVPPLWFKIMNKRIPSFTNKTN